MAGLPLSNEGNSQENVFDCGDVITDNVTGRQPRNVDSAKTSRTAVTSSNSPLIQRNSVVSSPGSDQGSTNSFFDMHRQNIRALSLIVCTFTYLMIGAAIFDALESEQDAKTRELVTFMTNKMKAKYNFSDDDYKVLETIIIKSIPHKAGHQWRFAGAFYFATVVITTVGYGHSTPSTLQGKTFCIFYALAGIPLNLVMFQSIGERLNTFICYCLRKARRWFNVQDGEVSMTHMIMVSSTLGSLVVIMGTYLFNRYEKWGYFESFYYCFITLTTIGFGDYVAMQTSSASLNMTEYVILSLLFILFGMALFAAAVNLFVLRFMSTTSDNESLDKPPMKTIILKGLSQSDNDLEEQGLGEGFILGRSGQMRRITPTSMNNFPVGMLTRNPVALANRRRNRHRIFTECLSCSCARWLRRFGFGHRPRYTIRRAPCRVNHLLYPNAVGPDLILSPSTEILEASPSEADSFLIHELMRRRPSV